MKKLIVLIFLFLFAYFPRIYAGVIQEISETSVVFSTSGIPPGVGDLFVSLDENNKVSGVYKIESIALDGIHAKILKGKPILGDLVLRYKTEVGVLPVKPKSNRWREFQWGIAAEGNHTQINLNIFRSSAFDSRQYPITLSGNAYGITAFKQGPFFDLFNFRLLAGIQRFRLSTTIPFPDCSDTTNCSLDVIYGVFGPRIQIDVVEKFKWRLWIAGGGNVLIPIKKESNIVNTHDLNVNINYGGSVGADLFIAEKKFITTESEFLWFPRSTTGKARSIVIRLGYGMNY